MKTLKACFRNFYIQVNILYCFGKKSLRMSLKKFYGNQQCRKLLIALKFSERSPKTFYFYFLIENFFE